MAKTLAHLLLKLGADSREFRSALTRGEKQLKQFAKVSESFGNRMTLGVTVPMVAAGAGALKLGMDAIEGKNLVRESFGEMTEAAEQWAEKLSKSLGLNRFEIEQSAAMLKVMTESVGLSSEEAFKMSTSMVELAADMESFYNLPHGQALDMLRSGLTGEAEPLKRLGILINDTTIKQVAWQNGIAAVGQQLTEQEKVQARYIAIMQQTSTAQGDLGRTLDSPANQLRALKNEMTQVATELGVALIPVLQSSMPAIKSIAESIKAAADAFMSLDEGTRTTVVQIAAVTAATGPMLSAFSSVAGSGAGMLKMLRSASAAATKLAGAKKATTVAVKGFSVAQYASATAAAAARAQMAANVTANGHLVSANVKAAQSLAQTRASAMALNGGLVVLAATLGYTIGTVFREQIENFLGLDEALAQVADKNQDWIDQLAEDRDLYQQHLDLYEKMRKKLGLVGEEWRIQADHTKDNAARLAELSAKVNDHTRDLINQTAAQDNSNRSAKTAADWAKQISSVLGQQDRAIKSVIDRTAQMYGIMTRKEAETQIKQLTADFKLLAAEGVPAEQLMEAFGPKVQELADAAGNFQGLNVSEDFKELAFTTGEGTAYFGVMVDRMSRDLPTAADKAKAALDGSIGSGMVEAGEKASEEIKKIRDDLINLSDGSYEITVKVKADTTEIDEFREDNSMGLGGGGG